MSADVYSDEGAFVIIPATVLDIPMSANAFRLYAVLRRYADNRRLESHPSRRTLATRMHVKDPRVVDKATTELVDAGLLAVFHRWKNSYDEVSLTRTDEFSEPTSNGYRLLRVSAGEGVVHENALPGASKRTTSRTKTHDRSASKRTTVVHENAHKLDPCELDPGELHPPTPAASRGGAPHDDGDGGLFDDPTAPAAEPEKPKRDPKGTRLPEGWTPDPRVVEAMERELPGLDLRAEHRVFVDWCRSAPGAKGIKRDWNAAWRNWMRREYRERQARGFRPSTARTAPTAGTVAPPAQSNHDAKVAYYLDRANRRASQAPPDFDPQLDPFDRKALT
ncbi:helix-turn-helix domain-containing protein [Rhodococcus ruber]|uniref:helix-turn-helix domain-containing protein n=1 Tax=Rhodococcus ruber TaxID=1830 RepID=UPI003784BFA4